jgi:hypothetical protein
VSRRKSLMRPPLKQEGSLVRDPQRRGEVGQGGCIVTFFIQIEKAPELASHSLLYSSSSIYHIYHPKTLAISHNIRYTYS